MLPFTQSCLTLCDPMDIHPGQNTGVGNHSLLQGIVPTQELNPCLPHCGWILYQLNHHGSPRLLEWVVCPFSSESSWPRNWTRVSCIAVGFFTSWATREAPTLCRGICKRKKKSMRYFSSPASFKEWWKEENSCLYMKEFKGQILLCPAVLTSLDSPQEKGTGITRQVGQPQAWRWAAPAPTLFLPEYLWGQQLQMNIAIRF